ncbi:MAG TPA: M23 family metallopeptidase [Thermoanaerobaculia bacterium]|nr:M23 family metallopeptidase [Thermoanaerobaculia bacterium]
MSRFSLVAATLVLASCATTATPVRTPPADSDNDFSQLVVQMRTDLNRANKFEADRQPNPRAGLVDKAKLVFAPLQNLRMPIVGITTHDLDDSWGAPRDGGERRHKGIDIFARRGTSIVAVADGIISYIGDQKLGGHCLWLTTESGVSFYYAHLDRWAPGIFEGMEVASGDLLGFVGNTGNAITTPPHLHFGINQNDEMVDPYPVLTRAVPVKQAHVHTDLGGGYGSR